MAEEPECADDYTTGRPVQEITMVGPDGGLANVFVHVTEGLPAGATYTAGNEPAVIDQHSCKYTPRVLGIMPGQPLEIRNSDPLLHNIKAKPTANRPFNISQPAAGMKTTRTFNTAEVMVPLECNVHGWMNAYVGVKAHPFFAVSGSDGSFTIANLPAGTYTIEAWHEKYGTQTATVTVADGEAKTQAFTFAAQ
jgi:plastocyanin